MKKDIEIQKNVLDELTAMPQIKVTQIGITVKNGIVTLSGTVDSYPKKVAVERAVLKIKNVQGIAEDITVSIKPSDKKVDSEIAQAVLHAITWHSAVHIDAIKILVEDGIVTLDGTVDWDFQRKSAFETIKNITSVKGVINNIKIAVSPMPVQVENKIHEAFMRNAKLDASKIHVEVIGNKVVLIGKVSCLPEKQEAEHTVWSLPGVTHVDNRLEVKSTENNIA